jgi:outer membrane receptor protein involved in Fe transport
LHDISVNWKANKNVQVYGGINNFTDEEPRRGFRYFPQYTSDIVGRYFYAGVRLKY